MTARKEKIDVKRERIERLKKIYAEWKKKQCSNDRLDFEEFLINGPDDLDLEKHWK